MGSQEAPAATATRPDHIALRNQDYSEAAYWQTRFATEASYEWLLPYASVQQWLKAHVQPSDRILMVGCGNSAFPLDMAADGYQHITATDLSANVVQHMQEVDLQGSSIRWQVADMLAMPFPDDSFDVVLEKAAIDCFFTDSASPWQPSARTRAQVHTMLQESNRVLTATGVLLSITFAQPHFRRPFLLAPEFSWGMAHTPLSFEGGMHHSLYAMRKGARKAEDQPVQLLDYDPSKHASTQGMTNSQVDSEDFLMCIDL